MGMNKINEENMVSVDETEHEVRKKMEARKKGEHREE